MSSTNRGYDRHKADFYVTPQKPIKEFLERFLIDESLDPKGIVALDPCAGGVFEDGYVKEQMSYPTVLEAKNIVTSTYDLRENSMAEFKGDYLFTDAMGEFNMIITNPPFNIAMDIIKKALNDVQPGGYVIMLLRLNFLGSNERKPFFKENMPKAIYVHSKRMNFITEYLAKQYISEGKKVPTGDSIEYAHFVWQKGFNDYQNECYPRSDYSMLHLI